MSAAVAERPLWFTACAECWQETPAVVTYVGGKAARTPLCAAHAEMYRYVDSNPDSYEPIPEES